MSSLVSYARGALGLATDEVDEVVAQRDRLLQRLGLQRAHSAALWAWYHGEQPLPTVLANYRDAYRLLLELSRTPWARLVVDTISERMHVEGFRADSGPAAEAAAWRLFLDSSLDADEWLVYTEALITGHGYVSVAQSESGVVIAPESSYEVTHEPAPGDRRTVDAALKVYPTAWGARDFAAELYRREATYRWRVTMPAELSGGSFPCDHPERMRELKWEPDDPYTRANPTGLVPIVPFENRATVIGGGVSELEDCIPILRRIDKLTLDKLMTSEFASFRQRWATGLEVPKDENGQPIEPYKAAVTRLWVAEGEAGKDVKFGTFEASEISPYLAAIDSDISALAAISRVPAHYLVQSQLANPPSAESLIAAESGLVAKVRERQRRFGDAWERAVAVAVAVAAGGPASAGRLEVIWSDAEMRNPAQVADAAVKLKSIGVPQEALWQYVGATPAQIAEWSLEAAATDLLAPEIPAVTA